MAHHEYIDIHSKTNTRCRPNGQKSTSEPTPPLLAPPLRVIRLEFCQDFWCLKTRVHGLSYGVVCVFLRKAILAQCRLVTDRRADRQTHDDSIYRASIASRSKN